LPNDAKIEGAFGYSSSNTTNAIVGDLARRAEETFARRVAHPPGRTHSWRCCHLPPIVVLASDIAAHRSTGSIYVIYWFYIVFMVLCMQELDTRRYIDGCIATEAAHHQRGRKTDGDEAVDDQA
jgi:hypothetical protein